MLFTTSTPPYPFFSHMRAVSHVSYRPFCVFPMKRYNMTCGIVIFSLRHEYFILLHISTFSQVSHERRIQMHQHSLSLHFFSIRSKMRRRGPLSTKTHFLSPSVFLSLSLTLVFFSLEIFFVTSANGIDHEREEEYYCRQQQHRRRAEKPKPITLKSIF